MGCENYIAIVNRLKRIHGQVRGIIGMIEEGRYYVDVLVQVKAVKGALAGVEDVILKSHADTCIEEALKSGTPTEQREKFSELIDLFKRMKC